MVNFWPHKLQSGNLPQKSHLNSIPVFRLISDSTKVSSSSSLDHNQLTVYEEKCCQSGGTLQHLLIPAANSESPSQCYGNEMVSCSLQCGTKLYRSQIQEHETECCPKLPMAIQVTSMMKKFDALNRELSETKRDYQAVRQELSVMKNEHDVLKKRFPVPPIQYTMYNVQDHIRSENRWTNKPFYSHFGGYKMKFDVVVTQTSKVPGVPVIIKYFVFVTHGEFDSDLKWPFLGEVTLQIYNHTESKWDHACKIIVKDVGDSVVVGRQANEFTNQRKPCEVQYNFFDYFMHYSKDDSFWFQIESVNVKI